MSAFERLGFIEQLIPLEGAAIECGGCGTRSAATAFDIEGARRLEGASDPDDTVTVIAARCPQCREVGTMVLGYGPMASEVDAGISRALGAAQAADVAEGDDYEDRGDRAWFGGRDR